MSTISDHPAVCNTQDNCKVIVYDIDGYNVSARINDVFELKNLSIVYDPHTWPGFWRVQYPHEPDIDPELKHKTEQEILQWWFRYHRTISAVQGILCHE